MLIDARGYPKVIKGRYLRAIGKMLDSLRHRGKILLSRLGPPEEVMHWWIHNADYDTQTVQTSLEGIFD